MVNGNCSKCASGCLVCDNTLTYCTECIPGFTLSGSTCINGLCTSTQYYNSTSNTCTNCGLNCVTCLSSTQCLTCQVAKMVPSGGNCSCDTTNGFFLLNSKCVYCGLISADNPSGYPTNCSGCTFSTNNPEGFECSVCNAGSYLSNGACVSCATGCSSCTGSTSCSMCISPQYVFSSGNCDCNANANYFKNTSTNLCQLCNLTNCSICSSLTTCTICVAGSFVNSTTHVCQPEICSNGRL